jgi:hypothetical protein
MALRRRVLWVLLFALVAAQTLGLLHRAAHAPSSVAAAHANADAPRLGGWVQDLFSAHDGDTSCPLFDQLNASGMMPSVPAACLPAVLPNYLLLGYLGQALARWAALFDARGPPSLR